MSLPVLIPGTDYKRSYNFLWSFVSLKDSSGGFVDTATLAYVSQLAKKVTPPNDEIETTTLSLGTLDYPILSKAVLSPITVEYLDDTLGNVYHFHRQWQGQVRVSAASQAGTSEYNISDESIYSFSYEDLASHTGAVLYCDTSAIGTAQLTLYASYMKTAQKTFSGSTLDMSAITELPSGICYYPSVFPIKIIRSPADKAGEDLASVSVTYVRVPNISCWTPYNRISS